MTINVLTLFSSETADEILARGLEIARVLGLDVTSWRAGDPTRADFKFLAEVIANYDEQTVEFIKAGFLSSAEGDWLTVLAYEVFGVERTEATYATPTVTLTNTGGGYYDIDKVGRLRVKCSATGKTYHNTSLGTLSAGATVTFDLEADEAGSDSSVAADDIDEIVTTMLNVEIDGSTAAVAADEQSDDDLRTQCASTLGALSPNGPPDAYEYVARNSDLTGVADVTRARTVDADTDDGEAITYLAGGAGPVAGASVTAVQNAFELYATPIGFHCTATNCTAHVVNVTATIEGEDIPDGFETTIENALLAAAALLAISDGTLVVAESWITARIHAAFDDAVIERVTLTGWSDITLAAGEVATIGAVSVTEV